VTVRQYGIEAKHFLNVPAQTVHAELTDSLYLGNDYLRHPTNKQDTHTKLLHTIKVLYREGFSNST